MPRALLVQNTAPKWKGQMCQADADAYAKGRKNLV
jgi:hypothetical protein